MPSDPLIGQTINDAYTIERCIGVGGMARVYSAVQHSMNRQVALKILNSDVCNESVALSRFTREAATAGKLRHSNTISIYDVGCADDGTLYIAMELLHGRTLREELEIHGSLPVARAVKIAVQICLSLAEAHDAGMVHRDLKPDNVFLTTEHGREDYVRVLDFGIVKILDDPSLLHLTATGSTPGTPYYMSPEAGTGKEVSAESDFYSLGVVLFEALSGERPFDADSAVQVVVKHLTVPPPKLSSLERCGSVPKRLEAVIERLLAKEPVRRYESADEVIDALLGAVKVGYRPKRKPAAQSSSSALAALPTAEAMPHVTPPKTEDEPTLREPVPAFITQTFETLPDFED